MVKTSMVTLLVKSKLIPFMSYDACFSLAWYLVVYKSFGSNDIHVLILVLTKCWPKLSNSNSQSSYLFDSRSQCMLLHMRIRGKGFHTSSTQFQDLLSIYFSIDSFLIKSYVIITLFLFSDMTPEQLIQLCMIIVSTYITHI